MTDRAQLLKNLESVIEEFGLHSLRSRIQATARFLSQPSVVDVAVFGRFKAGKSSFINELTGENILPVGVVPVTAVITRLKFGNRESIQITLASGEKKAIHRADLAQYISEAENPENIKQVQSVDIELPTLKNFEGLQFVDTPGLGSVFKHNTETSLNWLPQVGVAFVAVSVDPPLSEQDISFIRELQRFTPKIAVLLTKADLVTADQLGEIEEFIKDQLVKNIGLNTEIWPYSIKGETKKFKESLESKLLAPLISQKETAVEQIADHKLMQLKEEVIGLLKLALKASETKDSEKKALKEAILGEKAQAGAIREEFQMLAREYTGRTRPFIMNELIKSYPELERTLVEKFENDFPLWKGRLWTLSRTFEDWLGKTFREELAALSINQTGTFLKPLNDAHAAIQRSVRAFQGRLSLTVKETLGVDLKTAQFDLDITIPAEPDVSFSRLFDSHLDILSFAIPMTLFRGAVEKHFMKSIPPEIEKNLSRLASQWTEGINKSILRMSEDAQIFVAAQIEQVGKLLQTSQSKTNSIEAAVESF